MKKEIPTMKTVSSWRTLGQANNVMADLLARNGFDSVESGEPELVNEEICRNIVTITQVPQMIQEIKTINGKPQAWYGDIVSMPNRESLERTREERTKLESYIEFVQEYFENLKAPGRATDCAAETVVRKASTTPAVKTTCRTCSGHKSLECNSCNGKGSTDCHQCQGAGQTRCHSCHGSMNTTCFSCGGTGGRNEYRNENHMGQIRSVQVWVNCGGCGGRGSTRCNLCSGGKVSCNNCGGRGICTCGTCRGSGDVSCGTCGAHGYHTHFLLSKLVLNATSRANTRDKARGWELDLLLKKCAASESLVDGTPSFNRKTGEITTSFNVEYTAKNYKNTINDDLQAWFRTAGNKDRVTAIKAYDIDAELANHIETLEKLGKEYEGKASRVAEEIIAVASEKEITRICGSLSGVHLKDRYVGLPTTIRQRHQNLIPVIEAAAKQIATETRSRFVRGRIGRALFLSPIMAATSWLIGSAVETVMWMRHSELMWLMAANMVLIALLLMPTFPSRKSREALVNAIAKKSPVTQREMLQINMGLRIAPIEPIQYIRPLGNADRWPVFFASLWTLPVFFV